MCRPKIDKHKVEPYVPPAPPAPPAKPAELSIDKKGTASKKAAKKRTGKAKLRTDLAVPTGTSGSGVNVAS